MYSKLLGMSGCAALLALASFGCARTAAVPAPARALRDCRALPEIRFAERLCPALASGRKRITLRARHRHNIRVGQWVALRCLESQTRYVTQVSTVRHTTWRQVTDAERIDDGFTDAHHMLRVLRGFYPGIGWDDPATVYRWGSMRRCAQLEGLRHVGSLQR